jgi:hypothetical protein
VPFDSRVGEFGIHVEGVLFMALQHKASGVAAAVAVFFGASLAAGAPAFAQDLWGAIAVDDDGTAWPTLNNPTARAAEADAVNYCGGRTGCDVLTVFPGCGAIAQLGDTFQGGHGNTHDEAVGNAIQNSGGGFIEGVWCNG